MQLLYNLVQYVLFRAVKFGLDALSSSRRPALSPTLQPDVRRVWSGDPKREEAREITCVSHWIAQLGEGWCEVLLEAAKPQIGTELEFSDDLPLAD